MTHLAVRAFVALIADGAVFPACPFGVLVFHGPVCRVGHLQPTVAVVAGLARMTLRARISRFLRNVPVLLPPVAPVRERHCAAMTRFAEYPGVALVAGGGPVRFRPMILHPA